MAPTLPVLAPMCLAAILVLSSTPAHAAPSFTTLYNFQGGTDGAGPASKLIADKHSNLYGTTNQTANDSNWGTVYQLAPDGTETVLHSFTAGKDGAQPNNGLLLDSKGNLFGGTAGAGKNGLGTLYKLARNGKLTVLYSFPHKLRVDSPRGDLIEDAAGNLYGTAGGGADAIGVIFRFGTDKTFTVLHTFTGSSTDGSNPAGGVVMDHSGTLYGATSNGGPNAIGVLYSLDTSGTFTMLHGFTGFPSDGANPSDAPLEVSGTFYGGTQAGGTTGLGTLYSVAPDGTETILHNFAGAPDDGNLPAGRLLMDAHGNLFGVTARGGASDLGTVFKLAPGGNFTILHSFSGGADGGLPEAGLLAGAHGDYYGTTLQGGSANLGTVFRLHP